MEPDGDIPRLDSYDIQSNMTPLEITKEMIKSKLVKLNAYKSIGADGIHQSSIIQSPSAAIVTLCPLDMVNCVSTRW